MRSRFAGRREADWGCSVCSMPLDLNYIQLILSRIYDPYAPAVGRLGALYLSAKCSCVQFCFQKVWAIARVWGIMFHEVIESFLLLGIRGNSILTELNHFVFLFLSWSRIYCSSTIFLQRTVIMRWASFRQAMIADKCPSTRSSS